MEPVLRVKQLVKRYGAFKAVDGVDFSVPAGICFGLLGPNGAGKTTTIEMIEGVIAPSSGEIWYMGAARRNEFRNEVGIQFQETALLAFLTVRETLQTFRRLYDRKNDIDELVSLCALGDFQHQRNDRISGGQRQRFLLALAMINRPKLLFLDEPSTGLDPQARRNLWDIVETIRAAGRTIILTTHYMEEAQQLCDEIAIMDHGKIIAGGSPAQLIRAHCSGATVVLPRESFPFPPADLPFPHVEVHGRVEIQTNDINGCLNRLLTIAVDLQDMVVRSPNLEDVFLRLTGRQLRE